MIEFYQGIYMFGKAKDLAKMLQNANSLRANMEQAKDQLSKTVFSSSHDGIDIKMTGAYQIVDIAINNVSDVNTVINAIKVAHTDCINQIAKASQEQIQSLSKDFNIGDLLDSNDK